VNDVRRVKHFSIDIEDEAGSGARVLASLRDNDVDLVALWGYPVAAGKARLEIVPEDADRFIAAAKAANMEIGEPTTAFHLRADDRRGALAEALELLARAHVTLSAAHAISDREGHFGAIIYVPRSELQQAATALNSR
jgi:hypothetical protein